MKAQNTVEYGLLIAGIVLLVLVGTYAFGGAIHDWFAALAERIVSA